MVSNTRLTTSRALCPAAQALDLGYASAAVLAQLEAARLLARVDGMADGVRGVRGALVGCVTAAAGSGAACGTTFASLPHAVALTIFGRVPADQRARVALVCRAWRDALADPAAWAVLDLSLRSGITVAVTDATLRGAAARANGRLRELVLDGCDAVTPAARLQVVTANASTLCSLSCTYSKIDQFMPFQHVDALARAAPQLEEFRVNAEATYEQAMCMLRNDAPFGALKLRSLGVDAAREAADEAAVLALTAVLARHDESLFMLDLKDLPLHTPAALDAVCAEAVDLNLTHLELYNCRLGPASIPALVHVISSNKLVNLRISNDGLPLLDEPTGLQLAGALALSQLTQVILDDVVLWHDLAAGTAVLRALTAHPTLDWLDLSLNETPDDFAEATVAGAALGALVAANAPALTGLRVAFSFLGAVGLGPSIEALRNNTHLLMFDCCCVGMGEEFARERFLPAVRANTSLRRLHASESWNFDEEDGYVPPEVLEAEALVAARLHGAGGGAA